MITLIHHVKGRSSSSNSPGITQRSICRHQELPRQVVEPAASETSGSKPQDSAPDHQPDVDAAALAPGLHPRCAQCQAEKRAARIYRTKIVAGLIFPFSLQALDVTIVASALPWIANDFGEIPQLNWVIAAFNLSSAAFIPFFGQMADIFGRNASLQASVIIMMLGSALAATAPTDAFPVLLLGRGFQGLGCAGINVIVRVILADKVSLEENAKNWSIFSLTAGMSYGLGPVIGGYLTNSNWRWCFGINPPICLAAILLIFLVLRKELLGPRPMPQLDEQVQLGRCARFIQRVLTIDAGGQFLFLSGFGLLILALTWAGATYNWNDAHVLVPLCIGAVFSGLFVLWERLMAPGNLLARKWPMQKSMLPWKLIVTRDVGLLFYINFATGAAMYSVLYFCNMYFTMVKLYSPSQAGVQLLYYTPGLGVGVYLSMFMCNYFPKQTFTPLMLGSVIEAAGVGILAWALWTEHTPTIFGMMGLTGVGTGLRLMPGSLHAIGFFPSHIATVLSLMAVALPFGGTLALTIMSTVFNNTSGIGQSSPFRDFTTLAQLPEPLQSQVKHDAKMGIVWAYVAITPVMMLCVMAASCLGNVAIIKDKKSEGDEGFGDNLVHGFYLWHLLKGTRSHTAFPPDVERVSRLTQANGDIGQHHEDMEKISPAIQANGEAGGQHQGDFGSEVAVS